MTKGDDKRRGDRAAGVGRRAMMKLAAGAVIAPALPRAAQKNESEPENAQSVAHRFLSSDEFAMLDELSELIIPTDEHSPGARAAEVAAYIDRRLAESFTDAPKLLWRDGLKLIDRISAEMNGRPFMRSSHDQRIAVLTRMARNESSPEKPEEKFFVELKSVVARAYYTSKIGVHDELEYKGNTYLREFVGVDVSKG